MARVNVYLPDDLAEKVREARLPISTIAQQALRKELEMLTTTAAEHEILAVEVGDPPHEEQFRGRWLLVPDPDSTHSIDPATDPGAYYGVAQTAKGRIAVYVAHSNERWAASLTAYDSIEDAAQNGLPHDIEAEARGALGLPVWRDI